MQPKKQVADLWYLKWQDTMVFADTVEYLQHIISFVYGIWNNWHSQLLIFILNSWEMYFTNGWNPCGELASNMSFRKERSSNDEDASPPSQARHVTWRRSPFGVYRDSSPLLHLPFQVIEFKGFASAVIKALMRCIHASIKWSALQRQYAVSEEN